MNLGFKCTVLVLFSIVFENVLGHVDDDAVYFDNNTNTDYIADIFRRYRRQAGDNSQKCEIPVTPLFTKYNILGESETSYKPGDFVNQYSILEVSCNEGYALSPFASVRPICLNGKWSDTPTACLRTCLSLMSTETTTVTCSYNNVLLKNCIHPVKGTIAELSCNSLYEEPNIQRNPIRVCNENRWYPSISHCIPTCGIKHPQGVANVINGQDVQIGDYPWQIALYYSSTKEYFCSGSLIDMNIILTAAHCITDIEGQVQPASHYVVAAGKYFRKYDEERDHFAQYSNISSIHVPERYLGYVTMYDQDIAILILTKPLTLTSAVQPVCIQLNEVFSYISISPYDEGIVTGWGYTQEGGVLANVLQELKIPYIPFNTCLNDVPRDFRRYVTQDKICGGYKNNATSICRGDSGGALVFKNTDDRYFVQGIVSTSPATAVGTCNSNQYSLFTNVNRHIRFVQYITSNNSFQKPLECISDDCTNEQNIQQQNVVTKGCLLPSMVQHGEYILENTTYEYAPGIYVPVATKVTLICNEGYAVSSIDANNTSLCSNTGNWQPLLRTCDSRATSPKKCGSSNNEEIANCAIAVGDKSKQKCTEYGQLRNQDAVVIEVIEGVKPANAKEFPHMALIGFEKWYTTDTQWKCVGSLISKKFVLSAGQCILDFLLGRAKYVLLGELVLASSSDDSKPQKILIKNIIPHPEYQSTSYYHDLALFELESEAQLDAYVRPACLNTNPSSPTSSAVNSGWGRTTLDNVLRNELLKVSLDIFTTTECNYTYRPRHGFLNGIIEETQICAGSRNEFTEIWQESGGSPLQIMNTEVFGTYKIIGIFSFRRVSAKANYPGVYTRVSGYIKWIEDIVWP